MTRPILYKSLAAALVAASLVTVWVLKNDRFDPKPLETRGSGLHLAINLSGDYSGLSEAGFNLADVGWVGALDGLPPGIRGVLWLGNGYNSKCSWRLSDAEVVAAVETARDHPSFSGIYYIADEPHPELCPDAVRAVTDRSALIRRHDPSGRTFMVVKNGAAAQDEFLHLRNAADLIGVAPYPCNEGNAESGCDLAALRKRIQTALEVGIEPQRIVPVFQTFGQACTERETKYYRLPSEAETTQMLAVWDELVPPDLRPLDMAYSWGSQPASACPALKMANGDGYPDLQSLYRDYFAETGRRHELAQAPSD